jgi:DNA (cytosine-5)-methyltransferase 1
VEERADWGLLDRFSSLMEALNPHVVTMENVTNLRRHEVYRRFTDRLAELGYTVSDHDVECWRYGVPQMRTRLVVLASKFGPVDLPRHTHGGKRLRTVRHAISGLSRLKAGACSRSDPLHRSAGLSDRNLERIRVSKPGGTWRDWDPGLRSPCHLTDDGSSFSPVYGRMSWDAPAPTLTTRCFNYRSGRFGHPTAARAISLREAALLQSFPRDYRFVPDGEDVRFRAIGRLVGNAVPVRLGEIIGRSILRHLEEHIRD